MKSSDEINKGLECCILETDDTSLVDHCKVCPYQPAGLCFRTLLEDTLAYIQQLEEQFRDLTKMVPEWISVEERLPEDGIDSKVKSIKVMVAIKAKNGWSIRTQTRFKETRYRTGEAVTVWRWKYSAGEVTHWMPLPELPKEVRRTDVD